MQPPARNSPQNELDVRGIAICEVEADSPLRIDSYAPLASAIPAKSLQAIAGWRAQKLYSRC